MGMFWGKTLWLVVSVVCGVGSWALDPQRGCGLLLDPGVEWARPVCDQLVRKSPLGLNNIETDAMSSHHLWHTTTSTPIYLWCQNPKGRSPTATAKRGSNCSAALSGGDVTLPALSWQISGCRSISCWTEPEAVKMDRLHFLVSRWYIQLDIYI